MYTRAFYNKNLKMIARELRESTTPAEDKLWRNFLRFLKPRVHRQRSMGNFIVDFYIPKAKLAIEIDGGVHSDEKSQAKDLDRTMILNQSGIKVIRFQNEDVLKNFGLVCKNIKDQVSFQTKG